jgi:hypothetical protein
MELLVNSMENSNVGTNTNDMVLDTLIQTKKKLNRKEII